MTKILDHEMLDLFARKGQERPLKTNANGLKVRRVMQLVNDLAQAPLEDSRVMNLACGEGVYSIEAALRGMAVHALDARTERMNYGEKFAQRLGLANLKFEQGDVRSVKRQTHGEYDVVYFLGILYHLDVPDVFHTLEALHCLCRQFVIIDTHICLRAKTAASYKGESYEGTKFREHLHSDPDVRRASLQASIDNTFSFWFTKDALVRLLTKVGFTSVLECHSPLDYSQPHDRVTLVACKGTPVQIATYPWINEIDEEEIARLLRAEMTSPAGLSNGNKNIGRRLFGALNAVLRIAGCEVRRI